MAANYRVFTSKQIKDLNKQDRASQNIQLGTFLSGLIGNTGSAVNITGGFINGTKFGTATDYTSFESDGTMVFSGSATVWDDIVGPLTQSKQGANLKPDFDFTNVGYLFPQNDTSEILYMTVQMPHGYKEGSDIYPHVHWSQGTSACAVFKMDYKWFNIGDPVPTTFQTYVFNTNDIIYTSGSIQQLTSGSLPITGTSKKVSSLILIKLYRDDSAYAGDVLTFQCDIHHQKDTLGSRILTAK